MSTLRTLKMIRSSGYHSKPHYHVYDAETGEILETVEGKPPTNGTEALSAYPRRNLPAPGEVADMMAHYGIVPNEPFTGDPFGEIGEGYWDPVAVAARAHMATLTADDLNAIFSGRFKRGARA